MTPSVEPGRFRRPADGIDWFPEGSSDLNGLGGTGWQSNGGPTRRHPARALPYTLEIETPESNGLLLRVSLVGVFALYATPGTEPSGGLGGSIHMLHSDQVVARRDLIQGRHYSDPSDLTSVMRLNGDGTVVDTVGQVEVDGTPMRVDRLTVDVSGGLSIDRIQVKDLGTPASFVLFEVLFAYEEVAVCPFKGHGGHVALSEIGSILRLRDRAKLDKALHQLAASIRSCGSDLDEARGLGLTFLAAIVGAMLEIDAPRSAHKVQLDAARTLDKLNDLDSIANATVTVAQELTDGIVQRGGRTGDALIDRALDIIAGNFAREIDDSEIAGELNLSTSHFRYLFREATHQPFHRYIVSMRLEKARELLLQTETPVSQVASSVGFQSPAHFSRAFTKRFGMAPSALRQARR